METLENIVTVNLPNHAGAPNPNPDKPMVMINGCVIDKVRSISLECGVDLATVVNLSFFADAVEGDIASFVTTNPNTAPKIDIDEVKRINIKTGEILVVQVARPITDNEREMLTRYLNDILPDDANFMVTDKNMKLGVLSHNAQKNPAEREPDGG